MTNHRYSLKAKSAHLNIHYHRDIKEVIEAITHKLLKSCRDIGKAKRYDCPFKEFVMDTEGNFPFVIFCNAY